MPFFSVNLNRLLAALFLAAVLLSGCKFEEDKSGEPRRTSLGSPKIENKVQEMNRIAQLAKSIGNNDPRIYENAEQHKEEIERALEEVPELAPKLAELYRAVLAQNRNYSSSNSTGSARAADAVGGADGADALVGGCVNGPGGGGGGGGGSGGACPNVCVFASAWATATACAYAEAYACATCTNADGSSNSVCAWARGEGCAWAMGYGFAWACTGGGGPGGAPQAAANMPAPICPVPDQGIFHGLPTPSPIPAPTVTPMPTPSSIPPIPTVTPMPNGA